RVLDVRVGEALDEGGLVQFQVHSGQGPQSGLPLVVHIGPKEAGDQVVLGDVVHHPVSGEVSQVGDALVGDVEQAQLHQLIWGDVLDELDADVLVRRAAGGELVLEHPLGE